MPLATTTGPKFADVPGCQVRRRGAAIGRDFAAGGKEASINFMTSCGGVAARQAQVLPRDGQISAGRQAYKIQGVRGGPGFIEVVHAPNQAAFLVPPRPEILDVQVADGENGGSLREVGADFRPKLNPAVESGAKEREGSFGHVGMFQGNVLVNDGEAVREPALEVGCGFKDVHAECAGDLAELNVGVLDALGAAAEAGFRDGEFRGKFGDLLADALLDFGVPDIGENFHDPDADLLHFRLAHAARGDGRAAEADSAALHGGQRIEGNGVLIYGDAGAVESFLGIASSDAAGVHFDQEQVIVRAACDDSEA